MKIKTAVVTGGNGDIAKAIKQVLEQNGYEVLNPSRQELDVTKEDGVKEYFQAKNVDVLVNNAGFIKPHSIADNVISDEIQSINVNLTGAFICTAAVISANPDAIIVNVGSSAGTKARGSWSSYCAAKAGLIMATKCWEDENIKAICLSPGRAKTKMREGLFSNEDPMTLLNPTDFAKVTLQAINGQLQWGSNVDVTVNNIGEFNI